jgi:NhaA family Na+:H+ antiporter
MSESLVTASPSAFGLPHAGNRHVAVRLLYGILNRFLLLPLGVAIALIWANTTPESYLRFAQAWAFAANEIGMVFFLALVTQEVFEAVMPGGALHYWRHWALAVVAAFGGLAGAALTFLAYVNFTHETVLTPGWSIASAVDVAAGYYILRLIYPRRAGVLPLLLLIALITDAMVIAVVGLRAEGVSVQPIGAAFVLAAIGGAAWLRRRKVQAFWPYLAGCGLLSWTGLQSMGFHPALALVPIVPLMPHRPRPIDVFADRPEAHDNVRESEHVWNGVAQVALFMFGLVNGGVMLKHYDTGTWAVLAAALVGRPLGILVVTMLAVAAGLHLPRRMTWRDVAVIALATSSGFTFALFMSAAVLPLGAVSAEITLGALATAAGAVIAVAAARILGAGRFHSKRTD